MAPTWSDCVDVPPFFPAPFDVVGNGNSSLGTMSIRKSNWSDLLRAFAMSDRERVRRLLESAIINARAVISEINTNHCIYFRPHINHQQSGTHFRKLYRRV
jgi:hypothetical protein